MKKCKIYLILAIIFILTCPIGLLAQMGGASYSFNAIANPSSQSIHKIWAASGQIFMDVDNNKLAHYNGSSWSLVNLPMAFNTYVISIHGQNASNVMGCGKDGYVYKYNGSVATELTSVNTNDLNCVHSQGNIFYFVGDNKTFRSYNGTSFTDLTPSTLEISEDIDFFSVYPVSTTEIWIEGYSHSDNNFVFYLYDGSNFSLKNTGIIGGIFLSKGNFLYLREGDKNISKYNKITGVVTTLFTVPDSGSVDIKNVWAFSEDDIFISVYYDPYPSPGSIIKKTYCYDGSVLNLISSSISASPMWGDEATGKLYCADGFNKILYEVVEVTGISQLEEKTNFNIYPNPTTENAVLEMDYNGIIKIQISDITGKNINEFSQTLYGASKVNLNLSNFSKGIYLVEVSTEKEKVVKKIIKQ